MGSVLSEPGLPQRAPNCIGVYELHHESSGRRLVGIARDLAHTKFHHLKKLAAGLHENQELQAAYNDKPDLDFVFYPAPNRAVAEAMFAEIVAELEHSGRLFADAQHCLQPVPPTPTNYNS